MIDINNFIDEMTNDILNQKRALDMPIFLNFLKEELENAGIALTVKRQQTPIVTGNHIVSSDIVGIELDLTEHDREKDTEIEKYKKALESAKCERDKMACEYQNKIKELQDHHKFSIMQIDDVLVEFLGVTHEIMDKPADFEKILQEMINKNKTISDFLPKEPIEVADMLINAEEEYEHSSIAKAFCKEDKGVYRIFDVSELRQIAEHLLVYCKYHSEVD